MATDAEINLQVNIPPPKAEQMNKVFGNLMRLESYSKDYLKEAAKGADIAEAAKRGRERAALLGEEMAKKYEAGFHDGFEEILQFKGRQQQLSKAVGLIMQDANRAYDAWLAGNLTDDEMLGIAEKKYGHMETVKDSAVTLRNMVETSEQDLNRNNMLEKLIALNAEFNEAMTNEAAGARVFAEELRNAAGAAEDEAEALDLSIKGNEELKLKLLDQAKGYRQRANAAEKSAEVIEHEAVSIERAVLAFDGSEKDFAKKQNAIEKSTLRALDQKKKLSELNSQQDVANQRMLVNEEKLADRQQKRAEDEAKQAAVEEARAQREKLLQEQEIYRNGLLGKSKLELAEMLSTLNAEREKAVKIGDSKALEKLNWQYSAIRSAMRQAGMQANVTRMMFMQQAQTASRLAANVSSVASGLSSIVNYSKTGEVNITGFASSLIELWFTFKAGMGPIGWFMLALQGIQTLLNTQAEKTRKAKEEQKKHGETLAEYAAQYRDVLEAQIAFNRNAEKNRQLDIIRDQYQSISDEIKKARDAINETYSAEERRLSLLQSEEKTRFEIARMQLETKLIEGEISQEEYARSLLSLDYEKGNAELEARTKAAKLTQDAAEANLRLSQEESEAARNRVNEAKSAQIALGPAEVFQKEKKTWESMKLAVELAQQEYDRAKRAYEGAAKHYNVTTPAEKALLKETEYGTALSSAEKKLNEAQQRYALFNAAFTAKLGGRTPEEYELELAKAEEEVKQAEAAEKNAAANEKKAREDLTKAQRDLSVTINTNNALREQAGEVHAAKLGMLASKEAAKRATETRRSEIASIEQKMQEMTVEELNKLLEWVIGVLEETAEGTEEFLDYKSLRDKIMARLEDNPQKAEARRKKINKLKEEVDEMSLDELKKTSKKLKKQRNKYAKGSQPYEDYESARKFFSDRAKQIVKARREAKEAVLLEARIDKNKGKINDAFFTPDETGSSLWDQIMGTTDDGRLTEREVKLLLAGLKRAQRLRNSELEAVIRAILAEQAKNEKNSTKVLNKINQFSR